MAQGIKEQIVVLPAIEAEGHLIQIGGEMLRADLVPASNNPAFQERPKGINILGMDLAVRFHFRNPPDFKEGDH